MILESQIVATADVPNKNGRIYPKALLKRIAADHLDCGGYGCLGNIEFPKTEIPINKIAFSWNNLRLEGDNLLADITVMSTPCGEIIKAASEHFGFRTIGHATLQIDGTVGDDYVLIALSALAKDLAA